MGKKKLTKEEKETIFLTSEADDTWEIYTCNIEMQEKLRNFAEKYPHLCSLRRKDGEFGYEVYLVHKSRVSIRFMAPYRAAILKAKSESAKKHGISRRIRN